MSDSSRERSSRRDRFPKDSTKSSRRDNYEDRHQSRRHRRDERDSDRRRHRERSTSRDDAQERRKRRSRSPEAKRRKRSRSDSRSPALSRKPRAPLPTQAESFPGSDKSISSSAGATKQKPNYKPTGLLAKEANTVAGTTTVLKYHEPPEARKPPATQNWRLYVFKAKNLLDTIHICERSVWLFGRDKNVTDLLLEHPSISKQHAVLQFRYITRTDEFGEKTGRVRPYLIDLESANGTRVNGERVEASRFFELRDGDVVGFGESEREFVLMLPPAE